MYPLSPLIGPIPPPRVHPDDYAIVVGLDHYPALGRLNGAQEDAKAFRDWLIDPAGAGVPPANCRLILSQDFVPAAADALNAKPTPGDLVHAFDVLHGIFEGVGRVGRRLYIYLAGHGFSAGVHGASLLTANATRKSTGRHLAGTLFADWFVEAKCFDEVLLFMDCCREINKWGPVIGPPYDPTPNGTPARWTYALSTEFGMAARERPMPPANAVRGVFTSAVLAGLRGGVRPNPNGQITSDALEAYVREFVSDVFKAAPQAQRIPPFDGAGDLVLLENAALVGVEIAIRRNDGGDPRDIRVSADGVDEPMVRVDAQEGIWFLPTGIYKATIPGGATTLFEVREDGSNQRVQKSI
jgi:hypothetical protein